MYKTLFYQAGLSFLLYSESLLWIAVSLSCHSVAFSSFLGSLSHRHWLFFASVVSHVCWLFSLSVALASIFSESSTSGGQFMLGAHPSMGRLPFKCSIATWVTVLTAAPGFHSQHAARAALLQHKQTTTLLQTRFSTGSESRLSAYKGLQALNALVSHSLSHLTPWALSALLSAALSPDTSGLIPYFFRVPLDQSPPVPWQSSSFYPVLFFHGPYCHLTYLMFISLLTCLSHWNINSKRAWILSNQLYF